MNSIDGKHFNSDVQKNRMGNGTIGAPHVLAGGLRATGLNSVIGPFNDRVTYSGSWGGGSAEDNTDMLAQRAQTASPGSSLEVVFSGDTISIVGQNAPNGGRFNVYIDDVLTEGIINTSVVLSVGYYSSPLAVDATTIVVYPNTDQFPSSGTIQIDGEQITYSGKTGTSFTGCTRGVTATSHEAGATVYGLSSVVECYSPYYQDRIMLWRNNILSPGQHTLRLVLRADIDPSSSGPALTLNGFVVGGILGASAINTMIRHVTVDSIITDADGVSTGSFPISPRKTDEHLIGILGAYPVQNSTWAFPMWNPNFNQVRFKCSAANQSDITIILTIVVLGPSI